MLIGFLLLNLITSEVIELDYDSFEKLISEKEAFVVNFYVTWGHHCKQFNPVYEKLVKEANKLEITVAQVNAEKEVKLADKYYIATYPTVKLFTRYGEYTYEGERNYGDILYFLAKRTGNAIRPIGYEGIDNSKDTTFIICYFDSLKTANFSEYRHASISKDIEFFYTKNLSTFKPLNPTKSSNCYIYRDSDLRTVPYTRGDSVTHSELLEFIDDNYFPSVIHLSDENKDVLKVKKKIVVVFTREELSYSEFIIFSDIIEDFFETIQVVIAVTEFDISKSLTDYFEPSVIPSVWAMDPTMDMAKYKAENNAITRENILNFVRRLENNQLKRFFKSQPLPDNWNKFPVKVLTRENFEDIVFHENRSVFVFFFAPWCGHSKRFFPVWNDLALYFKNNPNVVFAKIDGTKNEFEIEITEFPTLLFFPRGPSKGYKSYKQYGGIRDFIEVKRFINNFDDDGPSNEL